LELGCERISNDKFWIGRHLGKWQLESPEMRLSVNIKMKIIYFRKAGCGNSTGIQISEDHTQF
jgi:hypothetical protein